MLALPSAIAPLLLLVSLQITVREPDGCNGPVKTSQRRPLARADSKGTSIESHWNQRAMHPQRSAPPGRTIGALTFQLTPAIPLSGAAKGLMLTFGADCKPFSEDPVFHAASFPTYQGNSLWDFLTGAVCS
jgi:hypothetical protein